MEATTAYSLDTVESGARVDTSRRHETAKWVAASGLFVFGLNAFLSRDLFWDSYLDLAGGRYIVHHGIPHAEVWTVAGQGRPWIDQQWLAHVLYYLAWRAGGYPLVGLLSTLLIAAAFCGLAAFISWRGVAPQRAALWTIGAFAACAGNTVIRAQSFAYPLFVALLALILRHSRKPVPSWELPAALLLLVVWANLHGTVVMGAALVALYCGVRAFTAARTRHGWNVAAYVAGAVGAALSFAATPYGLSAIGYYRALVGNGVVSKYIVEWGPPTLGVIISYGFFIVLFVVIGAVGYARGRSLRIEPVELAIVVVLALLVTKGVRYQAWFVIAGVSLAATVFAAGRPKPPSLASGFVRLLVTASVALAVFAGGSVLTTTDARFERGAPRGAIAAAAAYAAVHPRARVLADDLSSSALLWFDAASAGRVAFDARLEQFRQPDLLAWFNYIRVAGPGWFRVSHGYDVLLASSQNLRLSEYLRQLRGWTRIYAGADGIVLARVSSAHAGVEEH